MNLQHLRYMVEVERTGSITKAANNLFMGQPNLSKAIRDTEQEIGITVFKRTGKGAVPTEKGTLFLQYARTILAQLDKIEALYKPEISDAVKITLSVPRAAYVTRAFTDFVNALDKSEPVSIDFRETSAVKAIDNVCGNISGLAVIRYPLDNEDYFISILAEKKLRHELVFSFGCRLLLSADDPLARLDEVPLSALSDYTEVLYGDDEPPNSDLMYTEKNLPDRIYIYGRGSQADILNSVKNTFMWVSPLPNTTLEGMPFVQRKCRGAEKKYADRLIYLMDRELTEYEKRFIDCLYRVRDEIAE